MKNKQDKIINIQLTYDEFKQVNSAIWKARHDNFSVELNRAHAKLWKGWDGTYGEKP